MRRFTEKISLLFEKAFLSTRTRAAFTAAIKPCASRYLGANDIQLVRKSTGTAKSFGPYV